MLWIIGIATIIIIFRFFSGIIALCLGTIKNILTFILIKRQFKTVLNPETKEEIIIEQRRPRIIPCSIMTVILISAISYGVHIKQSSYSLSSAAYMVKTDIKRVKYLTYNLIPATKPYEIKSWVDEETGVIHLHADKK